MTNVVLLVFEGEKTEVQIFNSLKKNFFQNTTNTLIHATYNAEIYQLYREIKNDSDLDLIEILRERNETNKENLKEINREQVSQIYLFFDYDRHSTMASDDKIIEMLELFNEETENGRLFISYPMVEAVKHFNKNADFCLDECSILISEKKYKHLIDMYSSFKDFRKFDEVDWYYIISKTISKTFCITNDLCEKPDYDVFSGTTQNLIFSKQLENFVLYKRIAVLSGFPLFLLEYFGEVLYNKVR